LLAGCSSVHYVQSVQSRRQLAVLCRYRVRHTGWQTYGKCAEAESSLSISIRR
jgi:hypothetical protein